MALLDFDGFDNYGTEANVETKWIVDQFAAPPHTIFETGRHGTGEALTSDIETWRSISKIIPATQTRFVGAAFYFPAYISESLICFRVWDDDDKLVEVVVDKGTHQLVVARNHSFIAASVQTIPFQRWLYIEAKITTKNSTSAGDFSVRVNGQEWIDVSAGSDTSATVAESFNKIEIGGVYVGFGGVGGIIKIDDFYTTDDQGAAPFNTFLGPIRIETLYPNGNGATSDFVGSDADSVDNYLLIDEQTPDGDTTYIQSVFQAEEDLHEIESIPFTPYAIIGINAVSFVRKTDTGQRTGKTIVRTGGSNYYGTEYFPTDTDYTRFDQPWGLNPNTGVAWIETDITSLEIGQKVES